MCCIERKVFGQPRMIVSLGRGYKFKTKVVQIAEQERKQHGRAWPMSWASSACFRSSVHFYSSPALAVMIQPTSHSVPSLTGLQTRIKVPMSRQNIRMGRPSIPFAPSSRSAFPRLLFLVSRLYSALASSFSGLLLTIYFPVMGHFQTKCLNFAELYLQNSTGKI